MDLVTLAELVDAVGRDPLTPADGAYKDEQAEWESMISFISNSVLAFLPQDFATSTDDEVRFRADSRGEVHLTGTPVASVSTVFSVPIYDEASVDELLYDAFFDGVESICNLAPYQVVDVTYTHGYSAVPDDVKDMALEVMKLILQLGSPVSVSKEFVLGTETRIMSDRDNATVMLSRAVIDKYRGQKNTVFL